MENAITFIKENHNYEIPEIIALKPDIINDSYFHWIIEKELK